MQAKPVANALRLVSRLLSLADCDALEPMVATQYVRYPKTARSEIAWTVNMMVHGSGLIDSDDSTSLIQVCWQGNTTRGRSSLGKLLTVWELRSSFQWL